MNRNDPQPEKFGDIAAATLFVLPTRAPGLSVQQVRDLVQERLGRHVTERSVLRALERLRWRGQATRARQELPLGYRVYYWEVRRK